MLTTLLLSTILEFCSPINFPISLAGNFGEPRPNHFHGGIDIRTQRVEGKPIFSVADGYISRLTVGLDGFGNAVYITHPNGTTTIYGHLKKFIPQLSMIVKKWQYKNKKAIADVRLKPTDYPVARGQLIAFSGNTGASQAPHLHLEFHSTRTFEMLDPMDFLSEYIQDNTPPKAHALRVYPILGEGEFLDEQKEQNFSFEQNSINEKLSAWGKVGLALFANDYMEDSPGILGVRSTKLELDDEVIFESNVDSIPYNANLMVNSWGDYNYYQQKRVWFLKSFIDPGNTLKILSSQKNQGIINFSEERPYNFKYTLRDFFGNESCYFFTIYGKQSRIKKPKRINALNFLFFDRMSYFLRPTVSLSIRPKSLPFNLELHPQCSYSPGALSQVWSFYNESFPLFQKAKISLKLKKSVKDTSKLYIKSTLKTSKPLKAQEKDGWVEAYIIDLGASYEVAYDNTPPKIIDFSFEDEKLYIEAEDLESGISSYEAYVDGVFVLFEPRDKKPGYICNLNSSPIKKRNSIHTLKFSIRDNCNNKKDFIKSFKY